MYLTYLRRNYIHIVRLSVSTVTIVHITYVVSFAVPDSGLVDHR